MKESMQSNNYVKCPKSGETYVLEVSSLICPACGDVHSPECYDLDISGARFDKFAAYGVECYDRWLVVFWNGDIEPQTVGDILDERYNQWMNPEGHLEVDAHCCEEWLLKGLEGLGTTFTHVYVG